VRRETNPDDLDGLIHARGVLTSHGGKTSHAAVVARGLGRTCVCGAEDLDIDPLARSFTVRGTTVAEGDVIALDGTSGTVYLGDVPVVDYFEGRTDTTQDDLVDAVDRILRHADTRRRLHVRANADTPTDAARARRLGATGIGLCRTEHMFLGDRRALVERLILVETDAERQDALAALLPLQRDDFVGILAAMDGLPVTIRLLDPPLHEFLPDHVELAKRVAVAEATGQPDQTAARLLRAVTRLHEQNPMLGLRDAGFTLRRREGGADAGWHLKLPMGTDTRLELRLPLTPAADGVPAEFAALFLASTRREPLVPVARIDTHPAAESQVDRRGRADRRRGRRRPCDTNRPAGDRPDRGLDGSRSGVGQRAVRTARSRRNRPDRTGPAPVPVGQQAGQAAGPAISPSHRAPDRRRA
jgi:phosphohistidine swiveling domain-containing protein